MRNRLHTLVALLALGAAMGCGDDGDTLIIGGDGLIDDNDSFPPSSIFSNTVWAEGGAFSPTGTPPFDIPGNGAAQPTGVPRPSSNPANGSLVPYAFNDIKFLAFATYALAVEQINTITGAINNGNPTAAGDLVVLPSYATGTPENESYRFFQIALNGELVPPPPPPPGARSSEPGRTQVIGIAFGDGTGGYVPVAPYTDDTFKGALVWMKATKHPLYDLWTMDQRDWRNGNGVDYASSLRLLVRGGTAVAIIRESELDAIGATQFRWDVFSYTTNPDTDWSHDFTDWVAIP